MKRFKELLNKISKRIKKSNFIRLLKSKSIIKDLTDKVGDLEKDKQKLIDEVRSLNNKIEILEEQANRVQSMELIIEKADKSIKEKNEKIKELDDKRIELETELFNLKLELAKANIQLEEYEFQIADLKSNRYLIKKVKPGRTPNTNKTKISKPMSSRVTKYMRGEHE